MVSDNQIQVWQDGSDKEGYLMKIQSRYMDDPRFTLEQERAIHEIVRSFLMVNRQAERRKRYAEKKKSERREEAEDYERLISRFMSFASAQSKIAQNISDGDLISRKAAIDAIRASTSKYTGFMEMEMYTDDDAVEAIEALPSAQPEQQWIPCSKRLPFDAGYYLTTTTYNEVFCDYWNLNEWNRTEQVIAWMHLPEPYSERRQE